MTWTKTSDDFPDDCWTLSDRAYRLHHEGLTWSNRKLLDCRLPKDDVRRFARNGDDGVDELLNCGWWSDGGDCYVINHHAAYQRTREAVLRERARSVDGDGTLRPVPTVPVAVDSAARQESGLDWIYRYWDRDGVLLYVGISFDARRRAKDHRRGSPWWRFVARGTAQSCAATDSLTTEAALIRAERPIFNNKHSQVPWPVTVEYCARREAWDLVDRYLALINPGGQDRAGRDRQELGVDSEHEDGEDLLLPDDPDRTAHLREVS